MNVENNACSIKSSIKKIRYVHGQVFINVIIKLCNSFTYFMIKCDNLSIATFMKALTINKRNVFFSQKNRKKNPVKIAIEVEQIKLHYY